MRVSEYFETARGMGILSTADAGGRVDSAVYSRPRFLEDGTMVLIMRERLSHKNLRENPHAVYLYAEEGEGYRGVRLFLSKIREDQNEEKIQAMTRRSLTPQEDRSKGPKYLVYFRVERILPLVGAGDCSISL